MRLLKSLVAAAALFAAGTLVRAQATQPAADAPATRPVAKITDAAQPILTAIRDGYAKVKSLEVAGTVTLNLDAEGEKSNQNAAFTGSFQAPTMFRHEMKDDMLIISNGQKAFVYKIDRQIYASVDAPKERQTIDEVPDLIASQLQQQDPSILLSMVKDAAATLVGGVDTVDRGEDVTLDGAACQTLLMNARGEEIHAMIAANGLIKRMTIDLKGYLTARGVSQVNNAMVTIEYSKVAVDAPVATSTFDWTPPKEAQLLQPPTTAEAAQATEADPQSLVGKPAPEFSLKGLDGNAVSLASLKGSVVVLDFWATWCGPCIESMPHLSELNTEVAPKGVKIYAVNLRETPEKVKTFLETSKIALPILLDTDGKLGDDYKAMSIPETVVIDKEGNVAAVLVGFGPDSPAKLKSAVEAAMK